MKTCTKCNNELPLWCFSKRGGVDKSGAARLRSECKACKANIDRVYRDKDDIREVQIKKLDLVKHRNRQYILNYLKNNPCIDCGESDVVVLEFDHVRGEKIKNVSRLVVSHASIEVIQNEIDKCEVRCANCHKRITAKRGNFWNLNL